MVASHHRFYRKRCHIFSVHVEVIGHGLASVRYSAHTQELRPVHVRGKHTKFKKIRKFILKVFWSIIRKLAPTKISRYTVLFQLAEFIAKGVYSTSEVIQYSHYF
jgi:hypothetical protein